MEEIDRRIAQAIDSKKTLMKELRKLINAKKKIKSSNTANKEIKLEHLNESIEDKRNLINDLDRTIEDLQNNR